MEFKYEDGYTFIAQPKRDINIYFKVKDRESENISEQSLIVTLYTNRLFRVYCSDGKFWVSHEFVKMEFDEQQMNFYFKKPFEGVAK